MKKRLLLYCLFFIISGLSFGQTFSSTSSGAIAGTFADLSNTITVSNLGNLDGTNLGITSVEINIKGSSPILASIDMYLVAPNGHAVYIMSQGANFNANTNKFIFTTVWNDIKFFNWPGATSSTNRYLPNGNLNSFNIGTNPNGVWKLHAIRGFMPASVQSWNITFGNTSLIVGSPNQTRSTAIDLINNTLNPTTFTKGNNNFNGTFLAETKGSMVGSGSPYTETSSWFKFVPKCKNDRIEISSLNWEDQLVGANFIQAGVLSLNASNVIVPVATKIFKDAPYTFPITTFVPGNTYYLLLDADEGSFISYRIKWFEGTLGCLVNTITTSATPKTTFCPSESFSIPFTFTGTFTTGNKFTAELSDASGSFTNPIIIGSVDAVSATSVPVTLPSTLASGSGYKIRVNGSAPATIGTPSTAFKIINIPSSPFSFTGSPSVCANAKNQVYSVGLVSDATFYRWRTTTASIISINAADSSGVNVNFGTLNNTFSIQAVNACGASAPLQRTIVVNPIQTPSVSVLANKNAICQGDSVIFTAKPILGGTNPIFQWKINQTNAGINSNVFRTVSLKNSDSVYVEMRSNVTCPSNPSVVSNKIGVLVIDTIKPEITISGSTEFCQGSTVKYTASTKNKGTSPVFEWRINKILQSATDSVFSSNTLNDKDTIRVQLKSNAVCAKPSIVKASLFPLKVVNSVLPTVSIKGISSACVGTTLSFTTETTGAGANPSFIWKVNNQPKGTGPSFSSNTLLNRDVLTVQMTSDDACANPKQVDSDPIIISIQQKRTPTIILQSTKTGICQGDSFTFTASSTFAGTFAWKVNEESINTNSFNFGSNSLKTGDSVKVEFTSSEACLTNPKVADYKVVQLKDTIKPEITISGSTEFCQGSTVKYTASTKNKGTSPVFEWRINKILQSATDSVFSSNTLNDKDTIRVQLKSNAVCAKPSIVKASLFPLKVVNSVLPTVSIKGISSACVGTTLSFTTETTGAGANPSFIWKVNNQPKGTGPSFSSNTLLNRDVLIVQMTSDDACANPKQVDSDPIIISIQQKRRPTINLQTLKTGICQGDSFTFKASSTFAGTFAWKVNEINMNLNSFNFGSNSLKTGDSVKVEFTSTEVCLTNPKVADYKVVQLKDTIISEISISGDLSVCEGKTARYIATTKNGGAQPVFKWFRNNVSQTSSDSVFSTILNDKDSVWAVLESSARCIRHPQLSSNKIGVSVIKTIVPSISLSTKPISCLGEKITINSVVQSAGNTPSYTWYLNDVIQPNSAPSYSGSTFANGDKIKVELQSTERCANPSKVPSNVLVLDRKIYVAPSLSINGDTIGCKKQAIPIFLNSTENWTPPTLVWKVDGRIIPKIASAYYPENLAVGKHTIEVSLTSTDVCTNEYTLSISRTITVLDSIYPTIKITGDSVLCKGSNAFFQLVRNPMLKNQSYKWLVDGLEFGNESTFQSFNMTDGSEVVLEMKATEMCLSPNAIVSNRLKVKVLESILPEIILNVSKTEICPSEEITVSSQIINGNALQEFHWLKNGDSLPNETGEEILIKIQRDDVLSFLYKTELTCGTFAKTFTAPSVFVKDPPPALTFIKSPNDYCAQDAEIVFKTDSLSNVTYSWEYPSYSKASIEGNIIKLNLGGNISRDTLKVFASNECGIGNTIGVLLKPKNCPKLFIPNAINLAATDGNEMWHIQGIELYPKAKVDVFNRWGTNVFHSKGYEKPFDGTLNGKSLPTGTYYYVIEFVNESPIVGDLTILH